MSPADLPHVDEHATLVRAPREQVWAALLETLTSTFSRPPAAAYARLVGCADVRASGPLVAGATVPGFHVTEADVARRLVLEGRHRFSTYALVLTLADARDGTRLAAETRAAFPGTGGRLYRTALMRTGSHVLGVRRLLAGVRRRAES